MRLYLNEIKKLFTLKILIFLGIFWILMSAFFNLVIRENNNFSTIFGVFGIYQEEMFEKYGDMLSEEELEDFDIPTKLKNLTEEADKRIANLDIFKKYNITDFKTYLRLAESPDEVGELLGLETPAFSGENVSETEINAYYDKIYDFQDELRIALDGKDFYTSVEATFNSFREKWYTLNSIANYYDMDGKIDPLYNGGVPSSRENLERVLNSNMPVMREIAERKLKMSEATLIDEYTSRDIVMFSTFIAMFIFISTMIVVSPLLTNDRQRKVDMLQYSSATGRKITRIQFVTVLTSALFICIFAYATLLPSVIKLFSKYWDCHLLGYEFLDKTIFMDITLKQYLIWHIVILTVFCISFACVSFLIARHSGTLVNLMLKILPTATALFILYFFIAYDLFHSTNPIFYIVFKGAFWFPEIKITAAVLVISIFLGSIVLVKNKRAEI